MAKKKTRKQKILADSRHIVYHLENETSAQVSHPHEKKSEFVLEDLPRPNKTIALSSHSYIVTDLRKTVIVTGIILFAQIILFIILNSM